MWLILLFCFEKWQKKSLQNHFLSSFFSFSQIKKLAKLRKLAQKTLATLNFKYTNQFVLPFFPLVFLLKKRPNLWGFLNSSHESPNA
jgi:hypothetical protein